MKTPFGTQQFDQTDIEIADPRANKCFDARGTTKQKTVATFARQKPLRINVVRSGRNDRLVSVGAGQGLVYDCASTSSTPARRTRSVRRLPLWRHERAVKLLNPDLESVSY